MRQALGFRRQPRQERTQQHQYHQRERSQRYPYPTPNHSPSAQNAFQCPPRPSIATRTSPVVALERLPAPQPDTNALWHRGSSPPPRKLGHTTFRYRDLDPAREEIRLLRILPHTTSDGRLECEVLHTSLNDPRSYIALSYVWGDSEDTRIVTLEGHEFPVTVSLWQALERLRSSTFAVIVWADAVCINQQNMQERGLQVQLMTKIYGFAYEVMIWLGPEEDDSDLAMDLLQEITSLAGPRGQITALRNIIKDEMRRSHFRSLVELFERDYWTRLWVVQEVANAKKISVKCGSMNLPWETMLSAANLLSQCQSELIASFSRVVATHEDFLSRKGHAWAEVLSRLGPRDLVTCASGDGLLQHLISHRNKFCADARDKIYGILGILSEQERSQFLVDYSTSERNVFTDVVEYLLRKTRRLDVIRHAIHLPLHQRHEKIPSWVPDWSHHPYVYAVGHISPHFSAARSTDANFALTEKRRKLSISGVRIDAVRVFGSPLATQTGTGPLIMAIFQWRLQILAMAGHDNQAIHESFCLALCLSQLDGEWTPRQWMEIVYHILATLLKVYYPALILDPQLIAYADFFPNKPSDEVRDSILNTLQKALIGRRLLISNTGLLCIGPVAASKHDMICVPLGCSTPIILRKWKECYEYIGDVYVDSYMYGKAIDEVDRGERKLETFCLQ